MEGEPRAGGRGDGGCIGWYFVDYIMAPAFAPKQWKSLKDCIQHGLWPRACFWGIARCLLCGKKTREKKGWKQGTSL